MKILLLLSDQKMRQVETVMEAVCRNGIEGGGMSLFEFDTVLKTIKEKKLPKITISDPGADQIGCCHPHTFSLLNAYEDYMTAQLLRGQYSKL